MKKSLFLGLVLALFSTASFAEILTVFTQDPMDSVDIGNHTLIVRAEVRSLIAPVQFKAIALVAANGDTTESDVMTYVATPGGTDAAFMVDSLLGFTIYWRNVKVWLATDTDMVNPWYGTWHQVRTLPDPQCFQPTGDAVPSAQTAILYAEGHCIGHSTKLVANWGPASGSGFPFHTDTLFGVTGSNLYLAFSPPLTGLSPSTLYKYQVESFADPYVEGFCPWQSPTYYFWTTAIQYAETGAVSHSNVTQTTVTITANELAGSDGSYDAMIELADSAMNVLQSSGWIPALSDTTITHTFTGCSPGTPYLYRSKVQDNGNVDESQWESFTTLNVPVPSVGVDSIHEFGDGGTPYVYVNPNGTWPGSATRTVFFFWWQGHPLDSLVINGITVAGQVVFPSITDVPAGIDVFYYACVTNDGGTVCTNTASFDTDDPFADVLLSIGTTFSNTTNILIADCGYTCAPGDTAELSVAYGTVQGFFTDTMFVNFISGTATPDITLTPLNPATTYFMKLIAKNSSGIWSDSQITSGYTFAAQNPSFLISTTLVVVNGATVRVFGDVGGYTSILRVTITNDATGLQEWEGIVSVGNADFDETFLVSGLAGNSDYTIQACVVNDIQGSVCEFDSFHTAGSSTGIEEHVVSFGTEVTIWDQLGRMIAAGEFSEIITSLQPGVYVVRSNSNGSVRKLGKTN